jgi:hypothetical protein
MESNIALSEPATPINKTETAHGFFQTLQRELRDKTYDLISQEKVELIKGFPHNIYIFKTRTTLPIVRLVSKGFQRENDTRPLVGYHLQVSECNPPSVFHRLSEVIPTLAIRTTAMHLDLVCCQESPDRGKRCLVRLLPLGNAWAERMLQHYHGEYIEYIIAHLPLLERMDIHISCGNMDCAMALQSTNPPWSNMPKLSEIKLLRNVYDHALSRNESDRFDGYESHTKNPAQSPEFFKRRKMMATWTPSHGWNADAKVTEECRGEEATFMIDRQVLWF